MKRKIKAAADPAGHYARADAVRLVINRRRRVVMEEVNLDEPTPAGPDEIELSL